MDYKLYHGDCLDLLPTLETQSVDAIICDPPYGLSFMGKRWDYNVPSVAMWEECLRVLKPGGHLLSFGGSRTYHRMVVNVEDAGFEIRDCLQWIFGSGFPKSHDVSKAIDKMAGAEREDYVKPQNITEAAKQWDGWGTALKPAHEPIVLARKPITGTIAANVLEWGTGGINIDDCRVPITDGAKMARNNRPGDNGWKNSSGGQNSAALNGEPAGRWPANVIHDGSEDVVGLFPVTDGGKFTIGGTPRKVDGFICIGSPNRTNAIMNYGDTGSAARFFYSAKASKSERTCGGKVGNNHPTVKPLALMQYLCRLITPPGGVVLDPFMGSGSTGIAAIECGYKFIGVEMDDHYFDVANERIERTYRRVNGMARKANDTHDDLPLFAESA